MTAPFFVWRGGAARPGLCRSPAKIAGYLAAFGSLALTALDPAATTTLLKNAALGE
jgi:hypothetical protein